MSISLTMGSRIAETNRLPNLQSRLAWLVEQVERLTGLDRW